jgi:hypothetical protein
MRFATTSGRTLGMKWPVPAIVWTVVVGQWPLLGEPHSVSTCALGTPAVYDRAALRAVITRAITQTHATLITDVACRSRPPAG